MLQIKRMPVGQIGTNCYLLEDTDAKLCAVIDPGDQPEDIDREIRKAGLTLTMILITHGHYDHVLGVPGLLEKWPGIPSTSTRRRSTGPGAGDQYMLLAPVEGIHTVKEGGTPSPSAAPPFRCSTPPATPRVGDLPGGGTSSSAGTPSLPAPVGAQTLWGELSPDSEVPEAAGVSLEGNLRVCPSHEGTSSLDVGGPTTPLSGKPCDEPVLCRPPGEIRGGADPCSPSFPRSGRSIQIRPGGDNELVLSFSRGSQWCTARAVLRRGEDLSASAGWLPPNCRRRTQWYPPGSPAGPSSGPFTWLRWTAWGQSLPGGCSPGSAR